MQRNWSLPSLPLAVLAFTLFLVSTLSLAKAQEAPADFSTVTTGTIVCEEFESLTDFDGNPAQDGTIPDGVDFEQFPIPSPQATALGILSSDSEELQGTESIDVDGEVGGTIGFSNFGTFVLDLDSDLGKLEAFRLTFIQSAYTASFFDGDTLVDSYSNTDPDVEITSPDGIRGVVDWFNADMANVTRVEITTLNPGILFLDGLKASFLPCPEPPAETCFDQLADVKTEIETLLATATGKNARRLQCALDCLCWSQHDCFWVQPSGDRLTAYGSNVFLGGAYAICYLERVSDPQADVIIAQYLDALECLVDKEIEYAIANGGAQCYIDQAVDYADLAEVIDDEFDNQVVASLAYRLAWLNAYYSTY